MNRVIYLDTLFAFNFVLDYILISGVKAISKTDIRLTRHIAGAAVGGLLAVAAVLLDSGMTVRILGAPIMVLIAFGFGGRGRYIKILLLLLAVATGIGGGIFALYYLIGDGANFAVYSGAAYLNISPLTFVAALPISYIIVSLAYKIFAISGMSRQIASVELVIEGMKFSGKGLIDTGASLCEPLSGRQAIIVQKSLIAPIINNIDMSKTRLVPFSTVSGEDFMQAVKCNISVMVGEKRVTHMGVYAALCDRPLSGDGSYQIILGHAVMAGLDKGELFNEISI